jgi:hypothetical protein
MLTKAILTGGVLSVLAGSVVYFGTDGFVTNEDATVTVEDVTPELKPVATPETPAAPKVAPTESVEMAEPSDPPAKAEATDEKAPPQKKWLDQYLRKTVPAKRDAEAAQKDEPKPDAMDATLTGEAEMGTMDMSPEVLMPGQTSSDLEGTSGSDTGSFRVEDTDRPRFEVVKPTADERRVMLRNQAEVFGLARRPSPMPDYDLTMAEAMKLEVVDMRDSAVLEIVDHAVDRGDMGIAADILTELSTPELRDTARARLGRGLALRGNAEAAFAVLDEIEIDELAAPIRLELITALMSTRQERDEALGRN